MALQFALLLWLGTVAIAIPQTSAQDFAATNSSSTVPSDRRFLLITSVPPNFNMEPLTNESGLAVSIDQLKKTNIQGRLTTAVTNQDADKIQHSDIALISCELNSNPGFLADSRAASFLLSTAAARSPQAIVLYSTNSTRCSFTASNGFSYTSMYTTIGPVDYASIQRALDGKSSSSDSSRIILASQYGNTTNDSSFTKSPTTAVAMIILYSITGIITALFLIIIIIGAIRAHRHPERYGPRHVVGRPRQSRAKGIARAMLETLPIVKFGDKDDDKAVTHMELGAAGSTAQSPSQTAQAPQGASGVSASKPERAPEVVKTEMADGNAKPQPGIVEEGQNADSGLACSVCTDDFVKGQDIRVLPCEHKFHPECIDPWLLNVSGTCPLCRVDLRPTTATDPPERPVSVTSFTSFAPSLRNSYTIGSPYQIRPASIVIPASSPNITEGPSNPPDPNPTPPHAHRSRTGLSLYLQNTLNRRRMRDATPAERIEALRTLRTVNSATESESEASVEQRSRNRRSVRSSFHPSSRPTSGVWSTIIPTIPDTDVPSVPDRAHLPENER